MINSLRSKAVVAVTAMLGLVGVLPAYATTLKFTMTGSGTYAGGDAVWYQSSDPTPVLTDGTSTFISVLGGYYRNNSAYKPFSVARFFSDGGIVLPYSATGVLGPNAIGIGPGLQEFTGSLTAPVFSAGSRYLGSSPGAPGLAYSVTAVAVPEPATWAFMLIGFAGLGATLRSRRGAPTAA